MLGGHEYDWMVQSSFYHMLALPCDQSLLNNTIVEQYLENAKDFHGQNSKKVMVLGF